MKLLKKLSLIFLAVVLSVSFTGCGGSSKELETGVIVEETRYVECYRCHGDGICSHCNGDAFRNGRRCGTCNGTGQCKYCDGEGSLEVLVIDDKDYIICGTCKGSGVCDACEGTGKKYFYTSFGSTVERCFICRGSGKCILCKGEGVVRLNGF